MAGKILITGAGGFLGQALLRCLDSSYDLRALVRDRRQISLRPGLEIVEGDVRDERVLSQAVDGCETVIHLAAVTDPDDAQIREVNVMATQRLVMQARRANVARFIFLSSEKVNQLPWDDYAWSKAKGEEALGGFSGSIILRPSLVYGPGDTKFLGKLFSLAVRWPFIPVPAGLQSRLQPVFVDDVAGCIKRCLDGVVAAGVYTLAGPDRLLPGEFVATVVRQLGLKRSIVKIPWWLFSFGVRLQGLLAHPAVIRVNQLRSLRFDHHYDFQHTAAVFGIQPTSLEEGCRRVVAAWRAGDSEAKQVTEKLSVDIVIPVYRGNLNEVAPSVQRQINYYEEHLKDFDWRIVVSVNGPGAVAVCAEADAMGRINPRVSWAHIAEAGKGAGVITAWQRSRADLCAYVDVDLAADLKSLNLALSAMREPRVDIAVASRYIRGSSVGRSFTRWLVSVVYHRVFLRGLLRARFSDGQCGCKVISSRVAREVLPLIRDRRWFFESELLVIAQRLGYRIHEVPVRWQQGQRSGVRLWSAIPQFAYHVVRLAFFEPVRHPAASATMRMLTVGGRRLAPVKDGDSLEETIHVF